MGRRFLKSEFNLILLWSTITSNVHTCKFNLHTSIFYCKRDCLKIKSNEEIKSKAMCERNAVLVCLLQKNAILIFDSPSLSVRLLKDV